MRSTHSPHLLAATACRRMAYAAVAILFATTWGGCAFLDQLDTSDEYGTSCTSDGDCESFLLSCYEVERVDGRRCLSRPPGPEGSDCQDELECEGSLRCDITTQTCRSGGVGIPTCDDDQDCGSGRVCQAGRCVDDPSGGTGCSADADCGGGEVCEGGECVDAPSCQVDADCDDGDMCEDGNCVAAPECTSDDDCPVGEGCVDGTCSFVPECIEDADCSGDDICEEGSCVPEPDCRVDTDCPGIQLCAEGACVDCSSAANCAIGEDCIDGRCIEEGAERCEVDADCDSPALCVRGSCVEPVTCVDSRDCDDGAVCAEGRCEEAFRYVAIVSLTDRFADIDTTTPGPDLDAVVLLSGEDDALIEVATEVVRVQPGATGDAESNFDDPLAILGTNDASDLEDGTCDLGAEEPKFYSLGGGDAELGDIGYIVLSFEGIAIPDGARIGVYELDNELCSNVAVDRGDDFEVWVSAVDTDPLSADDWVRLGASDGGGGYEEFPVRY